MVDEVRIYVEGGGDGKNTRAQLREGVGTFLSELRRKARDKRIRWKIVACGGRDQAHRHFTNASASYPNALIILLVDSEGPVPFGADKRNYLHIRDKWNCQGATEDQCHLMVQDMEAWLLADPEALSTYYGQGFNAGAIPASSGVETIPKDQLVPILNKATKATQKGTYHKIRHGTALLSRVNPMIVRRKAPHCNDLFVKVRAKL